MGRERDLKTDPKGKSGQGRDNRLATLVGLWVHASAFDLAQHFVHAGHKVEHRFGCFVPCKACCAPKEIQIHAAGKVTLARRQHRALDRIVAQHLIDQGVQFGNPGFGQHIHRTSLNVPCDHGNAVVPDGHVEVAHPRVPFEISIWFSGRRSCPSAIPGFERCVCARSLPASRS